MPPTCSNMFDFIILAQKMLNHLCILSYKREGMVLSEHMSNI